MKQLWLQPLFPRATALAPELATGLASGLASRLLSRLACLLLVVISAAACSGQSLADPDGDETRLKARPFRQLDTTNDRLDAKRGDVEDWRIVLPEQTGRLNLRVEISRWKSPNRCPFWSAGLMRRATACLNGRSINPPTL